jgi:ribosomal protein S27AE
MRGPGRGIAGVGRIGRKRCRRHAQGAVMASRIQIWPRCGECGAVTKLDGGSVAEGRAERVAA